MNDGQRDNPPQPQNEEPLAPDSGGTGTGGQFAFLMPGVVHALGNAVFALRGNLQLLAPESIDPGTPWHTLDLASARVSRTLEVLRLLAHPESVTDPAVPISPLFEELCSQAHIRFRERGVGMRWLAEDSVAAVVGPGRSVLTQLLRALRATEDVLPNAFACTVEAALVNADDAEPARAAVLRVRILPEQSQLPFPIPVEEWRRAAAGSHELSNAEESASGTSDGASSVDATSLTLRVRLR